jgi:hypothetical protein
MSTDSAIDRRGFCRTLTGTVLGYSLMRTLVTRDLLAGPVQPLIAKWAAEVNAACDGLRGGSIKPIEWQEMIEALLRRIELAELLQFIEFDRLTGGLEFPDLGAGTQAAPFPQLDGLPERTAFFSKIFGLAHGRAIIPHGHRNMASCHLVLEGEFALRQYDKIEDQGSHLVIRPTVDERSLPGSASSISDDKDNVHWFRTLSDRAFTFDVIVADLDDRPYEIDNIDPERGDWLSDGTLRVPKLEVGRALKKYGNEDHHAR